MNRKTLGIFVLCFLWMAVYRLNAVVVADFDSDKRTNNLGGLFGGWSKDPQDSTQFCREDFDANNARTHAGYCLAIGYDVDSPNQAYNGVWMRLNGLNADQFTKLVIWIRGDSSRGFTKRIKIDLKTPDQIGAYYIDGISAEWKKIQIPLEAFNLDDLSNLTELVFTFEDTQADPKAGVIYLDDISFE